MLRLLSLILVGLFYSLNVHSQRAAIAVGEEQKTAMATDYYFAKGKGTDIIRLALQPNKRGVGGFARYAHTPELTVYNKRMEPVKENKLGEWDVNTLFGQFITIGSNSFLFSHQYDRDAKKLSLSCQVINTENLEPEGAPVQLGACQLADDKNSFVLSGSQLYLVKDRQADFDHPVVNYVYSPDSSKLLVSVAALQGNAGKAAFFIGVYDGRLTKIWDRQVELPWSHKLVELQGMTVTNNGEVAGLMKHYQTEKPTAQTKDGMPAYTTGLLVFEKDNPAYHSYPIQLNGLHVHSMNISGNGNGLLDIFGLYQQTVAGNCQGFFNTQISTSTKAAIQPKLTAFSDELISQVMAKKQGSNKGAPGIGNEYRIVGQVERSNGTKDYLLEYFTSSTYQSSTNGMYEGYVFGNIITISIPAAAGNSIVTKIPRYQQYMGFNLLGGVKPIVQNDKLLLFFNDDESNAGKKSNESPRLGGKLAFYSITLQMAVIDGMGNVKRSLIPNPVSGKSVAIKDAVPLGSNSMAIGLYGAVNAGSTRMVPGILTIR